MKPRRKYTPIRVDFTPFVSIALLLIVFFVWVKVAQKPKAMAIYVNEDFTNSSRYVCRLTEPPIVDANLILLANNRIGLLQYDVYGADAEFTEIDYSVDELRNNLTLISLKSEYGVAVLITPTAQSTFKNLVDVLDELRIVDRRIMIRFNNSLTPEESKMLAQYETYKASNSPNPVVIRLPVHPSKLNEF